MSQLKQNKRKMIDDGLIKEVKSMTAPPAMRPRKNISDIEIALAPLNKRLTNLKQDEQKILNKFALAAASEEQNYHEPQKQLMEKREEIGRIVAGIKHLKKRYESIPPLELPKTAKFGRALFHSRSIYKSEEISAPKIQSSEERSMPTQHLCPS